MTAVVHFPLNADLDAAVKDLSTADLADVRNQHEGPWMAGNIVRTLFCTAAVGALGWALLLHGRSTAHRTARASAGRPSWAPPATPSRAASSRSAEPSAHDRSVR